MLTINDIKLKRMCDNAYFQRKQYYKKNENNIFLQELIIDTILYTFHKVKETGDTKKLKELDKYFMIFKKEFEKKVTLSEKTLKEFEDKLRHIFKVLEKILTIENLLLKDFDVKEILSGLSLEVKTTDIIKATSHYSKRVLIKTNEMIEFKSHVILKNKKDEIIPLFFIYPENDEDPEFDPIINLTSLFLIATKNKIDKIVVYNIKNGDRIVSKSPKLNQMMFIEELEKIYVQEGVGINSGLKNISTKCNQCHLKLSCIVKNYKKNFTSDSEKAFTTNYKKDNLLSKNLLEEKYAEY